MRTLRVLGAAAVLLLAAVLGGPAARALEIGERAPELVGLEGWIGSEPQTLAALRGRVVIVQFWTFDCSNCRHTIPYVIEWHHRYAARGLTILGIHTPELPFERSREAVEAAVRERGIPYPVALDPSYATWDAYGNRYWPAFYFIDRRGVVRHVRFGEGGYADSEAWIERLLAEPTAAPDS